VLARFWGMEMSAKFINGLATLSRFPILPQAMIRFLAMPLLLFTPGARAEAKDCYRKALAMYPQDGFAQAAWQRVTKDEK